jgi:Tol biopolymer transport system component
MPQPDVVRSFKIICAGWLSFFSLGALKVVQAQAQAPGPSIKSPAQKIVYDVQTYSGGTDLIYGIPGGSRPATSDIYELVGPNVEPKQLAKGGQNPAWSARGDKIAYLGFTKIWNGQSQSTPTGTLEATGVRTESWYVEGSSLLARQIYVMNADGTEKKRITGDPNGVWDFAWSPVENKIAYCEQGKDGETAIVVINAETGERQDITKMGEIKCAVGRPVLKRTLDKNKTMTSTKSVGGKVQIKLVGPIASTSSGEIVNGELIGVPTLVWSPDGKFIAFTGSLNGQPVIGIVDEHGKAKPIGVGYSIYWSPDGKRILFRHDSNRSPVVTALCLVNADGTEPRKILDNEGADYGLAWFPDGSSIIFGSNRDAKNQAEIFRINVDGQNLQKIVSATDMSLSNPVVSPDRTKLIVDAERVSGAEKSAETSLLLVDIPTHQQEFLGKGSHASVIW